MKTKNRPRKRNRAISILLLPVALFIFIVGWSLIWIGSSKKPKKEQQLKTVQKFNVTLMTIPPEEQEATLHNKNQ